MKPSRRWCEYVEMLENQIAKSNNGIVRTKLLTFGVNVNDLPTARARLERVEADICGNFKKLGVKCRSLSGLERLELLHGQLHPGGTDPFRFSWDMIPQTGLSTKDFIAPDSFDFRFSRLFRVGTTWGAASYLQILASELSDKLLAELLEMDAEMTITLHIQTVDQAAAVKSIKAKVSDIDKMKVEEQKKAARSGYDMDILPPDLVTYSNDAKTLLEDLQSRNERMFLLTFLVVNMAPTRRELDNDLFTVSGIVQKYKDFLASPEIENIFENSDFLVLLSQAQGDRQILAKQLGISPHQLSYVTHTNSGEGLLFFGNTTIPFVDRFPQNTELYAIMTTRPEDKKQEMNRA